MNPADLLSPLRRLAAALTLASSALSVAAAAPPPAEHVTRRPAMDDVELSPSGKRLAMRVFGPNGRRRLGVLDLDPLGKPRIVAAFGDADVRSATWLDDDRLVFEAARPEVEIGEGGAGSFAVDHDGGNQRQLIAWRTSTERIGSAITSKVLPYGWFLHSVPTDPGKDVFVYRRVDDAVGDLREIQFARMNTVTGTLTPLSAGMPEGARRWLVDAKGEPRVITSWKAGRIGIHWRPSKDAAWVEVANFDEFSEAGFEPLHVEPDGRILVATRVAGDVSALHAFDPATRRLDPEPLLRLSGYDLDPALDVDGKTQRLLGVHSRADRPFTHWFDAGLRRIQAGVDAALPPGRFNRLYCGDCLTSRFIVVLSRSDRQPGEYFLFDRSKASLEPIGAARPWIDEAQQGRRTLHRVTARDGLVLPVYVTHPAGAAPDQPLPTVVLVHGGPWVRGGDLRWDREAAFFASRGYRVLQPEFRGSEGYGERLFRAGWKQWGRTMQDDLVDTLNWAVAQKLSDPARACIAGGSYGGYAALMAPIASPGVFRCAASFAGVTDIGLMYSVHWSDISEASRRHGMPVLIGDPAKDRDALDRVSPIKRVAEIRIPVMVAYGGRDRRVPEEHAKQFLAAARRAGVAVEEVAYPTEGHGFVDPLREADHLERLERFIARSLAATR